VRSRSGGRGEHAHGVVDALGQGEPAGEGGVPQASQLLLGPVRGSGTDISAIISRESPILPGRWAVRPGAPVHHVVCYARHEPGGQQDVHQVPDRHQSTSAGSAETFMESVSRHDLTARVTCPAGWPP
jgi:hypothetical protein